jgi:LPXTG-motif cell wall-anchored protein
MVTVNQCNDSVNGGGSTVTCNTSITTIVLAPEAPPAPPGGGGGGSGSGSSTDTLPNTGAKVIPPLFLGGFIVVAVGGLLVQASRRSVGDVL